MLYRLLLNAGDFAHRLHLAGPGLRSFLACFTALVLCLGLGFPVITLLKRLKLHERTEKTPIEDEALRRRIGSKTGTPTMGGLMVLAALLGACGLWADMGNVYLALALCCAFALSLLGIADDQVKLRPTRQNSGGLKARHKLLAQGIVGAAVALVLLKQSAVTAGLHYSAPLLPVVGRAGAALFVLWATFVVGTMSNATNVTDGLDGLVAGLTPLAATVTGAACWVAGNAPAAARLGVAHVPGAAELSVFCGALSGACLGFLWYNRHPARVFMGDVGALAIGGGLAAAALAARQELVLGLVAVVFLVEFGSSLLQIGFFKLSGRRILPVAPIHHIFEKRGDPEPRIVHGFYLWGAVAALIGLNLMCLR